MSTAPSALGAVPSVVIGAVMCSVAAATAALPAGRVARVNPQEVLRDD